MLVFTDSNILKMTDLVKMRFLSMPLPDLYGRKKVGLKILPRPVLYDFLKQSHIKKSPLIALFSPMNKDG